MAPMESHFSTAGVSAGRQFQCFRDAICESVIRLGARRPRTGPFAAEIRASRFGPMRLTEVRCDAVTIERTRLDIARESGGVFYVTLQLAGLGRVVQRGREANLRAGEFTVLDSTEPYALHFDAPVRRLVVEVPRHELQRRAGAGCDLRGVAFRRGDPGTGLAFDAFRALAAEAGGADALHSTLAARVLDLAVAAMTSGRTDLRAIGRDHVPDRLVGIREYAASHLGDPDLSPAAAARANGVSVRHLHQLFRGTGHTFGTWVREQRLDRCRDEIADPVHALRSISEIAFSHGFNDAAHFSRAFSRRFGEAPSALRAKRR
jgi:AraC-like DNA-binding protein